MRIEKCILLVVVFFAVAAFSFRPLWAATIEVENDDDETVATPTIMPTPSGSTSVEKAVPRQKVAEKIMPILTATPMPPVKKTETTPTQSSKEDVRENPEKVSFRAGKERVRISDKVNFFSFAKAGFLVADPSEVHEIGTIVKTGAVENYTLAQKPAMEVNSDQYRVKKGDLFFVVRCDRDVQEPHLGLLGYQVENLALVQVIEAQKTRHLLEVKKSFKPFLPGDRLIPYESEIRRWKQAQVKKVLPDHSVLAYVAGLDNPRTQNTASDIVLISAGNKNGVVEGLKFQFFRIRQGEFEKDDLDIPIGSASVLYCGPNYSIAQILTCSEPIETGFQAVYRP